MLGPYSSAARTVSVVARTLHLAAMALLVGGLHFQVPAASLRSSLLLTVGSGVVLLLTEVSHSRHWAYQGRGVAALAHVALAWLAWRGAERTLTLAALVVGAVGSHLPRAVRKWSLRHRRVVD